MNKILISLFLTILASSAVQIVVAAPPTEDCENSISQWIRSSQSVQGARRLQPTCITGLLRQYRPTDSLGHTQMATCHDLVEKFFSADAPGLTQEESHEFTRCLSRAGYAAGSNQGLDRGLGIGFALGSVVVFGSAIIAALSRKN